MVNHFIKKLITRLTSTIAKSAYKAYENTVKNRGGAQAESPFKKYFDQIAQQNPMAKRTMTKDEALKVFNMEGQTELDPEKIMETYTAMFSKNDPSKGGSFYLQSKVWCAKEEIMKEFPGAEKEFYKKHGVEDPTKAKKGEEPKKGAEKEAAKETEGKEEAKEEVKEDKKEEGKEKKD